MLIAWPSSGSSSPKPPTNDLVSSVALQAYVFTKDGPLGAAVGRAAWIPRQRRCRKEARADGDILVMRVVMSVAIDLRHGVEHARRAPKRPPSTLVGAKELPRAMHALAVLPQVGLELALNACASITQLEPAVVIGDELTCAKLRSAPAATLQGCRGCVDVGRVVGSSL